MWATVWATGHNVWATYYTLCATEPTKDIGQSSIVRWTASPPIAAWLIGHLCMSLVVKNLDANLKD